ncbi:MAG: response regulator [Patescibacteria group bacterium]
MPGDNSTILIIDDEADIRDLLKKMLGDAGFEVSEAPNAPKGLKWALEHHPDLVITDIIMPETDGLTMLQQLRADAWGKSVPTIVLSGLDDEASQQIAKDNGVAAYIVKTNLIPEVVVAKVREVLHLD